MSNEQNQQQEQQQSRPGHSAPPLIVLESGEGIGRITLNRPEKLNLLTREMLAALHAGLEELRLEQSVRVIILAAGGRAFSAGHDLKEINGEPEPEVQSLFDQCDAMMSSIRANPKPVIAQVQGMAVAAGLQLVASCDLVVASEQAVFGTTGIKAGLFCSTPMVPLSRVLQPRKTLEMLLTGDTISAQEAHRAGLVNRLVSHDTLEEETRSLAAAIARHSPYVIGLGKEAFYRQLPLDYRSATVVGKTAMVTNAISRDGREGMSAFLEKRAPSYKGEE